MKTVLKRRSKAVNHRLSNSIDIAQTLADFNVATLVEILDGHRKCPERFPPQLINPLLTAAMQYRMAEIHRFDQAFSTLARQRVPLNLDPVGLQLNKLAENIRRTIKQRACEHRRLDAPPASAPGPGVLLRGHGFAQAGLRHVEGLPVPEPASPDVDKTEEAEKARRRKKRKRRQLTLLLTGIVTIATVMTLGMLWFNGVIGPGAQEPTGSNERGTRTVPAVVDASGRVTGQEIRFTWSNPDPQPDDSYLVEVVGAPESEARHSVDEPSIVLPMKGEQTCVKIVLRRAKGQVSEPVQTCVRS